MLACCVLLRAAARPALRSGGPCPAIILLPLRGARIPGCARMKGDWGRCPDARVRPLVSPSVFAFIAFCRLKAAFRAGLDWFHLRSWVS
jgi:hypothetical protein